MKRNTKVSFIPQKSLAKDSDKRVYPINILLFISLILFFLTLSFYGGLYLYKANLDKVINEKEKELIERKQKIDSFSVADEAKNLQKKINNVSNLLNKHVATSRIFMFIEEVTLKNVRFKDLNFGTDELTDNTSDYSIKLKGEAPSYASLAYQIDVLKNEMVKDGRVKDFIISDVRLGETRGVLFDINIILQPSYFLYGMSFVEPKIDGGLAVPGVEAATLGDENKDIENQN